MRAFVFVSALVCSLGTAAQTVQTKPPSAAIYRYNSLSKMAANTCRVIMQVAEQKTRNNALGTSSGMLGLDLTEVAACIEKTSADVKGLYEEAVRDAPNPAAAAALKEHLIAYLVMVSGIEPEPGEIRLVYSQRQSSNSAAVSRAWIKFETEK